jgi:ArsR family transcriptional regulator, arsenate/arsenite/antimonite-responsive transcriptional repressor
MKVSVLESQARAAACCARRAKHPRDTKLYATLLKALADETRLDILGLLAAADGELCVCHIEAHVKHLSQPTISHHLKQLREAGLVTAERRGTWVHYAIDKGAVARLREFAALLGG